MIPRVAILVVLVALAGASCAARVGQAPETTFDTIASRELPTSDIGQSVGEVTLPDVSDGGAPFALRADKGRVLVVYFGFTSCPDICPTTLADLKTALASLGDTAASVEVAMITVDPQRDSAETLVDYVQWFVPGAHALRTEDQAKLDAAGEAFGASFSVVTASDGEVAVLHSAYLYGIDDTGRVVVTWPFGAEPQLIASDIGAVLDR